MKVLWRKWDNDLDINKLMEHFDYPCIKDGTRFRIYKMNKNIAIVFFTENGYRYYLCSKPERKLTAFDLVLSHISTVDTSKTLGLWSKIDEFYAMITIDKKYHLDPNVTNSLVALPETFNHFDGYAEEFTLKPKLVAPCFENKVFEDNHGSYYFPFYNLSNKLTGYGKQQEQAIINLEESDTSASIWYSEIPNKIKHLVIFNNPLEALAFQEKFNLEETVYLALSEINYETTKILIQIYKKTKVGKMALSFTGLSKIQGYIDDLMLISSLNDGKFFIKKSKDHLVIQFDPETEKFVAQLHKELQRYNESLNQEYLKYNKFLDHSLVNQKSIVISKYKEMVICRLPLEINALRYFLWSYYRNYLGKMIEIFKPTTKNWQTELNMGESAAQKDLKSFKIAI